MKKVLAMLLIFACLLCFADCAGNPDASDALTPAALLDLIYSVSTPGEPITELITPGTPTPLKHLRKAGDALLNTILSIRLEEFDPFSKPVIIYDPATAEKGERTTLILELMEKRQNALIQLATDYGSNEAFRTSFDGRVSGTVTAVYIISGWDYRYPEQTIVNRRLDQVPQTQSNTGSLYGYYSPEDGIVLYSEADLGEDNAFSRVRARFAF